MGPYQIVSRSLLFQNARLDVLIIDDSDPEFDETISISYVSPVGFELEQDMTTITIQDDESFSPYEPGLVFGIDPINQLQGMQAI